MEFLYVVLDLCSTGLKMDVYVCMQNIQNIIFIYVVCDYELNTYLTLIYNTSL